MTDTVISRGLDQLVTLLASISADDPGRPTPCAAWTVADLADHLVFSVAGMAAMARGEQVDWDAPVAHHDDPASAFASVAADLRAAVAAAGDAFPVGMAAGELAVHAYDLATGLGRGTGDLDPEVAEAGHAFMSASLTDEMRGGAFGPAQAPPPDADAYQRAAAFAGRTV